MNEKRAYILGCHLGDGYFCTPLNGNPKSRRHLNMASGDKEQVEYFAKCFSEFGLMGYDSAVRWDSVNHYWRIQLSSRQACDFVAKHVGEGSRERKHWPSEALSWSRECKLAFLAGLCDSDGYISQMKTVNKIYGTYPRWQCGYSTTGPWVQDFVKFVQSLGIVTLKLHQGKSGRGGKGAITIHMRLSTLISSGMYFKVPRKQAKLDAYKLYHSSSVSSETTRLAPIVG